MSCMYIVHVSYVSFQKFFFSEVGDRFLLCFHRHFNFILFFSLELQLVDRPASAYLTPLYMLLLWTIWLLPRFPLSPVGDFSIIRFFELSLLSQIFKCFWAATAVSVRTASYQIGQSQGFIRSRLWHSFHESLTSLSADVWSIFVK